MHSYLGTEENALKFHHIVTHLLNAYDIRKGRDRREAEKKVEE